MANAIVTLLCVAIVLAGVGLMAEASFKSMDELSDAWKQMEVRSGEIARTEMEITGVSRGSGLVNITVNNTGQTSLRDFESWDVVVEYYQATGPYHQRRLTYTTTNPPPDNQWTVTGIYVAATGDPEVHQPDILDPDEKMVIAMKLSPSAKNDGKNLVVIGALNGVTVSSHF